MLFFNLTSIYLLGVTVAVVYCAVQIRTLSGAAYTKTALYLCFAICFYILGYAMELNAATPAQILFWNKVQYIGIPFVSALWLTTALIYTGHFSRHKKGLLAAIYIIPALTLILRLTNDAHQLYFASVGFKQALGGLFIVKQMGPFMYVQLVHSVSMILIAMGLLVWDSFKAPVRQWGKIALIALATFFAISGLILTVTKPAGLQLDYMALYLPFTCIMMIVAIGRYDLLEAKSVARQMVFEAGGDAIFMLNPQNRILDSNDSAKKLLRELDIRLETAAAARLFEGWPQLLAAMENPDPTIVKLTVEGRDRWYDVTTEDIGEGKYLRGRIKTLRDVTDIYQLNEELSRLAMTDELSVLSNRRAFLKIGKEWISRSEAKGSSLHLLMMDLDFFKYVNDRYGHPTGDLVIHEFSQILKEHFGGQALIARLGGEEFAVMVADTTDDALLRSVNALLEKAEQHTYHYFGNTFHVTVSVGMTKRAPGQQLDGMMSLADKALYLSKDKGRSCVTAL